MVGRSAVWKALPLPWEAQLVQDGPQSPVPSSGKWGWSGVGDDLCIPHSMTVTTRQKDEDQAFPLSNSAVPTSSCNPTGGLQDMLRTGLSVHEAAVHLPDTKGGFPRRVDVRTVTAGMPVSYHLGGRGGVFASVSIAK